MTHSRNDSIMDNLSSSIREMNIFETFELFLKSDESLTTLSKVHRIGSDTIRIRINKVWRYLRRNYTNRYPQYFNTSKLAYIKLHRDFFLKILEEDSKRKAYQLIESIYVNKNLLSESNIEINYDSKIISIPLDILIQQMYNSLNTNNVIVKVN